MEKSLEEYKAFVEVLLKVVNDLEKEYPEFTIAVARTLGREVTWEESQKYNFHFIPKHSDTKSDYTALPFCVTLIEDDIKQKKEKESLTYYNAIYNMLKDRLHQNI